MGALRKQRALKGYVVGLYWGTLLSGTTQDPTIHGSGASFVTGAGNAAFEQSPSNPTGVGAWCAGLM